MRFPKLVVLATMTIFALTACAAAATPVPVAPGAVTASPGALTAAPSVAATPQSSVAVTPAPGTTSPTAGSSGPVGGGANPCTLLSAADLKTVTGSKYAEGVFDAVYNWCDWVVPVKDGGGEVIVAIALVPFATVKGALTQGVDLTVSGHAAFWDPESGVTTMLVDLGGKTLELSFPKANKDVTVDQAMAQRLAELALSKM